MIPSQSTDQSTSQSINQPINLFTHRSITHQSITDQSINDQSTHRPFYEDECEPALISPKSAEFYIYLGAILALLLGGGLISGLTIGLFSLSHLELAVLTNDSAADLKDRKRAKKLRPLLREDRHHLLLVTLLLTNTGCMEALPELLDKLVPEWAAVVISVSLVVLFSEILPQAICTRAPLAVGAFFSPLCWLLMLIMFPIAWPISKALDWLIGAGEGAQFLASRSQVTSLLEIIQENHVLSEEEASIMKAVISIKQKTIKEVMIDASDVYMLEMNEKLTASKLQEILRIGHSRIPVYRGSNKANIQGMLLTKRLIVARPEDEDPVSKYLQSTTALLDQTINQPHHHTSNRTTHSDHVLKPIWVKPDTEVFTLLDEFQRARCHLAIVADDLSEVALAYHADKDIVNMTEIRGIVTMEDLVEIVLEIDIKEREHEDGIDKQFVVDSDDELPSRKPRIVDPRSAQQSTLNEMLSNLTILAEQKARTKSRIANKPVMPPLRRAKTTLPTNQSTSGSQTPTFNRSSRAINQPISRSPGSMLKQPLLLDEEAKENSSNWTRTRSNSNSLNRSINQSLSLSVDTEEKILPDTPEQSRCRSEAIFTPVSSWRRGASRRNLLSNLPVNIHPSIDQSINQSPSLNGKSPQMSWSDSPVLMEEHLPNGQTRVTIASKQDAEARLDVIDERINQPISSSSDDSSGDEGAELDIVSAFASKILDTIAAKRKHSSDEESTDEDTPTNQSTKSKVTSPIEKDVSNKEVKSPKESINQSTNQSTKSSHHHHDDDDDNLLATPHHLTGLVGPASLTS